MQQEPNTMGLEVGEHLRRKNKVENPDKLNALIKTSTGKTIHLLTSNDYVHKELTLLGKLKEIKGEGKAYSRSSAQKEYRGLLLINFQTKVSQLLWNLKRIKMEDNHFATIHIPKLSSRNTTNGEAINIEWETNHLLRHIDANLEGRVSSLAEGISYHQRYTRLSNMGGGVKTKTAGEILRKFKLNNKQITLLHLKYMEPYLRTPIRSVSEVLKNYLNEEQFEIFQTLIANLVTFLEMAKLAGYGGDYCSLVGRTVTEIFVDLVVNSTMDTLMEI